MPVILLTVSHFFFTATAPTEIYTLSLHDALPIFRMVADQELVAARYDFAPQTVAFVDQEYTKGEKKQGNDECGDRIRSEEHTSELQSRPHLVCRLLLEKKKNKKKTLSAQSIKERQ